ncbi:MAG: MATE family efflux transporter [Lachnospiraceae bacterium]|jgi:putative MATE family efflux protein
MQNQKHRLIGDRKFYQYVLGVAVPIMVQNGITNFVSMLDNIMIGLVGTNQMSGVSVVNQLLFVFNLCVFGGLAGIGIFTAQFYGSGDDEAVRYTFRFKLYISLALSLIGILIFCFGGDTLIRTFLKGDGSAADVEDTFHWAHSYLQVMLLGIVPFAIAQVYSGTLRETGETVVPMNAGIAAVLVNLFGNWVLIYGKLGAPAYGAPGAAAATVISRFVELGILVIWTHRHADRNRYIVGVYRSPKVPLKLAKTMAVKGAPLLANETLWAGGMTVLTQNYSLRGLTVIAALNISQTISNVFNIAFIAMGNAIAIILGQLLGAGEMEKARDYARKLIFFSTTLCVGTGLLEIAIAPFFPRIYNTTEEVRHMASGLIMIAGAFSPMYAFENACYFTIRSGGKTLITFLFDSAFVWIASIPFLMFLVRCTDLPILPMYALVQSTELIKCLIGFILVKKGIWVQNLAKLHTGSGSGRTDDAK